MPLSDRPRTAIRRQSRALVTLGGGQVKFAREWDDQAYGLDFVQIHSYPDVRYQDRDESVFGRTAADFGLSKPLLIGECPSDPRAHPEGHLSPAYTLEDYLRLGAGRRLSRRLAVELQGRRCVRGGRSERADLGSGGG